MSEEMSHEAWLDERCRLSLERLGEIADQPGPAAPFGDYFKETARFMLSVPALYDRQTKASSLEELQEIDHLLYKDILPEGYGESYANPAVACDRLGQDFGPLLSWLLTEVRALVPLTWQGRHEEAAAIYELFIEICNRFEQEDLTAESIRQIIYWYISDYSDQTVAYRIREALDPSLSFFRDLIMTSDLSNPAYLYRYGCHISENELGISAYLAGLSQAEIDAMAATFVEGYLRGFEIYKIDLSDKRTVQIRANIGFERVLRSAVRMFEDHHLTAVIYGEAVLSVSKGPRRIGFQATSPNPQYDYDHRMDRGLVLDKALVERITGVTRAAYESYKDMAAVYAGPAVMEIFGEQPFEPLAKEENIRLTPKQEKLAVKLAMAQSQIVNQYIDAASTSFTIIAWPVPSIGPDFEAIMHETIKVNNLDNDLYRKIQQVMIDAMDGAHHMHVTGMNGNCTDLCVSLWQLKDPAKETVFENCCADVNIPVGEVFTSPVLSGTDGILNVSSVYLDGLNYRNLKLVFKDGMVVSADCANYEDPEKNQAYLKQNLLQNHETLPMGEFAIGTNTTAYTMAGKFGISALMPILIMEKTGPHFAVGDTCYSHAEDHKVYNPDGKEIVARENACSALRDTDPEKAYFNVHTDITIPYNEIGAITAVFADGTEVDIIREGRFCLKGTEVLNEALTTGN